MDFTLKKYEELLGAIKKSGLQVYRIKDWIEKPGNTGIILRHDVDRLPKNALQMAKLEYKYNIKTTYYFRILKHTFKPNIIKAIAEMGHEVGYHYEDLSLAKGDFDKAIQLFQKHLDKLREIAPIDTIAMHGRPLSAYDNRDLWNTNNFSVYNIKGDAFLNIDYTNIYYLTDTGRTWKSHSNNLRDNVETNKQTNIYSSNDLISFVHSNKTKTIAIVAHPERWNNNIFKWLLYFLFDMIVNLIKNIKKILRKN